MSDKPSKPFDTVDPALQPTALVEVRGMKVQEIKWTDKQTRREERMDKYTVAGEFSDGTQVMLSQIGRDFTGVYDLQRGKHYLFALRGYEIDRDTVSGEFTAVSPVDAPSSPAPAAKPLPTAPGKSAA